MIFGAIELVVGPTVEMVGRWRRRTDGCSGCCLRDQKLNRHFFFNKLEVSDCTDEE